jgi:mannose/fructose/sorbose-specific phosphotransferase system IIA component
MSQIGVVIASHGDLAQALISSAEMIVGAQEGVVTVCLDPQDNLEACHDQLCSAIDGVQSEAGVIVLIDLFGGTPGNAAVLGLRERTYSVVAGANLPMLLEVLMSRGSGISVKELTDIALQAGQSSIIDVGARFEAQLKKES